VSLTAELAWESLDPRHSRPAPDDAAAAGGFEIFRGVCSKDHPPQCQLLTEAGTPQRVHFSRWQTRIGWAAARRQAGTHARTHARRHAQAKGLLTEGAVVDHTGSPQRLPATSSVWRALIIYAHHHKVPGAVRRVLEDVRRQCAAAAAAAAAARLRWTGKLGQPEETGGAFHPSLSWPDQAWHRQISVNVAA
jgi:hypothetical protein